MTYYRDLFDRAGITPEHIQGVEDLHLLPITSKDDLRSRPLEQILATGVNPHRLVSLKTSGSSGRPFIFRRHPFEEHLINMFRIRARQQIGFKISDRIAVVTEGPLSERKQSRLGHIRQALGIYRKHRVDCYQSAENILFDLERIKPDVIIAYPSVLAHMAAHLLEAPAYRIQPRLIVCGGETLSSTMRDRIRGAFGASVFDFYGAHEFNLLAWECPEAGGYHVCDDGVVLEVLHNGRAAVPGESGEVVATGSSLGRSSIERAPGCFNTR